MNVLTLPRTVAALEYKALRLPATVVGKAVSTLDEESRVRLAFEKALGNVDATVGRLIGDEDLTRRGTALSRKAEVLETAVALEEKAEQRKQQAAQTYQAQKSTAAQQRREAEQEKADETRRLREQEKARKQAVKQQADAKERAAAQAVQTNAQAKIRAERERLAETEERIQARTSARTAAPKAQLSEAIQRKQDADSERAAADRMAQLADVERSKRQAAKQE
jgi:hypothetical protein